MNAEEVRELIDYDPETGLFQAKTIKGRRQPGWGVGCISPSTGYRQIGVGGKVYLAHRLAWLITHGEWPSVGLEIDHINGEKDDNRIVNLRLATKAQNQRNSRKRSSTTGLRGVRVNKASKTYSAQIKVNRKNHYLGSFQTPEEAHAAYVEAAVRLHGEFASR
jgi:HNH endonuclease/AP2 domain